MSTDSATYVASAVIGALVGGLASLGVSAHNARRERRARYGEALINTLSQAQQKVVDALATLTTESADEGQSLVEPVALSGEAARLWAQAELAGTLERTRSRRRAMQGWAIHFYDSLNRRATDTPQLQALEHQLDLGIYLVIAWTARHASGRDFRRAGSEVEMLYGPHPRAEDRPDYGFIG